MRRFQFDALVREHDGLKRWRPYLTKTDFKFPIPAMVTTGALKNRPGYIDQIDDTTISVWIDGTIVKTKFDKVTLLDEVGQPIIEPVRDATGREVRPGAVVCFSTGGSKSPHALEIGRVTKVNESGSLSVRAMVCNGAKIERTEWNNRDYTVSDPDRAVLLPVDDAIVQKWITTDFRDFDAN